MTSVETTVAQRVRLSCRAAAGRWGARAAPTPLVAHWPRADVGHFQCTTVRSRGPVGWWVTDELGLTDRGDLVTWWTVPVWWAAVPRIRWGGLAWGGEVAPARVGTARVWLTERAGEAEVVRRSGDGTTARFALSDLLSAPMAPEPPRA
ncbi:hypothetical protein [Microbacterium sp.]|uniref:hypothetical protein n=1 Tax=Microbacterium sp. TaxID=51671 RepID=UPI003A8A06C8